MMYGFDARALDRHITGNYGEDQFDCPYCRSEFEECTCEDDNWQEWALSDEYDAEDSRS